ncbi:MAG: response regulator [Planctomycetota bacterium]|jgi:signal transduction histidine kinase|nr:response regulator [Planctomycetota bacterium]
MIPRVVKRDFKQLLFVCAVFLLLALMNYFYVGSVMRHQIDLHSRSELRNYQTTLRALILTHENALRHVALSVGRALEKGEGPDEVQEILKLWTDALRTQTDFKDVFVSVYGYLDGNYLDGTSWIPGEFYHPKTAPWMRGAITKTGIFHSKPYVDPRTGNAVSAFSMVIFDKNGDSRGVLALDFLLTPVIEQVKEYKVADAGFGMLMDDSLNILTYRDVNYIGKPVAELPGYYGISEKLRELGAGTLIETIEVDGAEHVGFFSSLENGWYLGITAPIQYYYSNIEEMFAVIGVLCLASAAALCATLIHLSAARMRSEDESRAKTSFLARMSHEIRTPMNAIIGMSELAQREWGTPQALDRLTDIRHAGAALLAIINDILDFSNLASGSFRISPAPYAISSLLEDVLAIANVQAKAKLLDLTVEIDANIPAKLIGDEIRIRQILLNLLSNAVKYTKEGGVIFRARSERRGEGEVDLIVTVIDFGIGIQREHIGVLFRDFVRLSSKETKHIQGTGLGLSIARSLCLAMGGDISVESEYGKGSTFTATMRQGVADWTPADFTGKGHCGGEAFAQPIPLFAAPGFQVLIVDDIATNLAVASGLLSPFQMELTTCLSGREAVALARKCNFDLIFIDHMMPEMDGIETANEIRKICRRQRTRRGGRRIPFIALTANAMAGMREMFLANGFDDYLSKPIDTAKLHELLAKWIPPEARIAISSPASFNPAEDFAAPAIAGLDLGLGLKRIGGSLKDYLEVLEIYCGDVESSLPVLNDVSGENIEDFTIRVHALKTASANVGAVAISEEAAFLEEAGKKRDLRTIGEMIGGFRERLLRLTLGIRGAVSRTNDANADAEAMDNMPAADDLRRLKAAIGSRDIGVIDRALNDLSAGRLGGKAKNMLAQVSNHVLTADFDEAEKMVDDLLEETGL